MSRTWKCVIILALLLIVGAVTVPIVLVARFAGQGGAVRAEIARIKAEGAPTSADDLAGKPIPDSENAAVIYEKAFKQIPRASEKRDQSLLNRFNDPDERARAPELWAQARTVVVRYAKLPDLARKAARMPKCRFHISWGMTFETKMPQYDRLKFLAGLARARASVEARAGNTDQALDSTQLIFAISSSMKDEPVLLSALLRYGLIATGAGALKEVAELGDIREGRARTLADALSRISLRNSMTRALQGERAMGVVFFDQFCKGRLHLVPEDQESSKAINGLGGNPAVRLWLRNDEAYYLREMATRIERAERPYRTLRPPEKNHDAAPPRYAFVSTILMPVYSRATAARDRATANLAGSRIFLGLLAYHDHFASYPARLDELKAKLNWQLPEDPFSGKLFVYRRQGKGFILYSIGDDLKDNGGVEADPATSRHRWPGRLIESDIVWKRSN